MPLRRSSTIVGTCSTTIVTTVMTGSVAGTTEIGNVYARAIRTIPSMIVAIPQNTVIHFHASRNRAFVAHNCSITRARRGIIASVTV